MFSGLANLKKELITAVADTKLSKPRRELGLLLLDEIDQSQLAGYIPSGLPDGYLVTDIYDTVPQQTQYDIVTCTQLRSRWWNDPNRPKSTWDMKPTSPAPTPVCESATPDCEEEFD